MPTINGISSSFFNAITKTNQTGTKPTVNNKAIKDWTQDSQKGDKYYTGEGSGQGWYPIWKSESEIAAIPLEERSAELSNPNSPYYKSIGKQIRSQLTGALSPDSLLALTVAMGGSPAQAQQQIKAKESQITEQTGNLLNNYYLNASSQSNSLLTAILANSQFNQNQQFQKDMYDKQKSDSLTNTILSGLLGAAGTAAGAATGGLAGGFKQTQKTGNEMGGINQTDYWLNQ